MITRPSMPPGFHCPGQTFEIENRTRNRCESAVDFTGHDRLLLGFTGAFPASNDLVAGRWASLYAFGGGCDRKNARPITLAAICTSIALCLRPSRPVAASAFLGTTPTGILEPNNSIPTNGRAIWTIPRHHYRPGNTPGDTVGGKLPPVAGKRPHSFTHHGTTIEDAWHWLRDPGYPNVEDPDVLAYLQAENEYFESSMAPYRELTEAAFDEMKARQQPDLSSVPWRRGGWYYQWRFQEESPVPCVASLAGRRSKRAGSAAR